MPGFNPQLPRHETTKAGSTAEVVLDPIGVSVRGGENALVEPLWISVVSRLSVTPDKRAISATVSVSVLEGLGAAPPVTIGGGGGVVYRAPGGKSISAIHSPQSGSTDIQGVTRIGAIHLCGGDSRIMNVVEIPPFSPVGVTVNLQVTFADATVVLT